MSWPGTWASGPCRPYPVIRPWTRRWLRSRHSFGLLLGRSATLGRLPSIVRRPLSTRRKTHFGALGVLEVDGDRAPAAPVDEIDGSFTVLLHTVDAIDAQNLRARIAQHHCAPGTGSDGCDFDDLNPCSRP